MGHGKGRERRSFSQGRHEASRLGSGSGEREGIVRVDRKDDLSHLVFFRAVEPVPSEVGGNLAFGNRDARPDRRLEEAVEREGVGNLPAVREIADALFLQPGREASKRDAIAGGDAGQDGADLLTGGRNSVPLGLFQLDALADETEENLASERAFRGGRVTAGLDFGEEQTLFVVDLAQKNGRAVHDRDDTIEEYAFRFGTRRVLWSDRCGGGPDRRVRGWRRGRGRERGKFGRAGGQHDRGGKREKDDGSRVRVTDSWVLHSQRCPV
jgi:hypothetical protein